MADKKHITLQLRAPLGPVPVHVPLPLDQRARAWVDDQLERVKTCVKREQMAEFRDRLNWLPQTMEQYAESERLYAAGHNYHDACARAMGKDFCECPDCGGVPMSREAR